MGWPHPKHLDSWWFLCFFSPDSSWFIERCPQEIHGWGMRLWRSIWVESCLEKMGTAAHRGTENRVLSEKNSQTTGWCVRNLSNMFRLRLGISNFKSCVVCFFWSMVGTSALLPLNIKRKPVASASGSQTPWFKSNSSCLVGPVLGACDMCDMTSQHISTPNKYEVYSMMLMGLQVYSVLSTHNIYLNAKPYPNYELKVEVWFTTFGSQHPPFTRLTKGTTLSQGW